MVVEWELLWLSEISKYPRSQHRRFVIISFMVFNGFIGFFMCDRYFNSYDLFSEVCNQKAFHDLVLSIYHAWMVSRHRFSFYLTQPP